MSYFVYILASARNGTLYIGVTNDLRRRVYQHKTKIAEGFTKKYDVDSLVYFEAFLEPSIAIAREKQMKRLRRTYKIKLIENENYEWRDLYTDL